MRHSVRQLAGVVVAWRPLVPFAVLFILLILFAVGGMLVIAHEADRSDAARAREAVTRTFEAMVLRLDSAVEMNAASSIADVLADPLARPESIYPYLVFTNPKSMGYYGTLVLNVDGSAFAGTRFGLPWTGATLTTAAGIVMRIAAWLPTESGVAVHRLVRDASGQVLAIALVTVPPASAAHAGLRPQPVRRMAMIVPVAGQIMPYMLPSLGVEAFQVSNGGPGDNAVAIPVDHGAPIVLAWTPRPPGRAAIARWAPAIGALLLTALVMLVNAGRSNIAALRALKRLAHSDHLTGLANRSAFSADLARRQARGDPFALGMIDLNGFKAVNDEHGHMAGDTLLQAVATELAQSAASGDLVARLGGDEFAWISPSRDAANRLAETFAARIAEPLDVGEMRLQIGAAIGVALAVPGMSASALMARADARLYASKHAARPPEQGSAATGRKKPRRRTSARDPQPGTRRSSDPTAVSPASKAD